MVVLQHRVCLDIKNAYFQDKNSFLWQDSGEFFWGSLADFFSAGNPGD